MDHGDANRAISLSPREEALFSKIHRVASLYDTTVRVAGGWVRDKLMGRNPDDIDLVVDNMGGIEFAKALDIALPKGDVCGLRCIDADPLHHKFLSTATLCISGFPLEITSFRCVGKEHLSPSVLKCPAATDAYGRDFTINSLFYNISTKSVEDYTGMGVNDVSSLILRCPMDPSITLCADPLRVLRGVRLASSNRLHMHKPVVQACRGNKELRNLFSSRIKRERISTEMCKILMGPDAPGALRNLQSLDMIQLIFHQRNDGDESASTEPRASWWTSDVIHRSQLMLDRVHQSLSNTREPVFPLVHRLHDIVWKCRDRSGGDESDGDQSLEHQRRIDAATWLSCLFFPLINASECDSLPFSKWHMREVWKYDSSMTNMVWTICEGATKVIECAMDVLDGNEPLVKNGELLRRLHASGGTRVCIATIVIAYHSTYDGEAHHEAFEAYLSWLEASKQARDGHPSCVWTMKPHHTGRELMELLGVKPGKVVGQYVKIQLDWMMLCGNKRSKEECARYLIQKKEGTT